MDAAKLRILLEADAKGVVAGTAVGRAAMVGFESQAKSSVRGVAGAFRALSSGQIGLGAFASEVKRSANDLSGSFVKISNSAKVLGAATLGFGALALAIGKTIGPAIEFESAFAGVRKTVDGTTGQLADIRDGLLDMSRVMPASASQLASIAENAGQLGVAAPDVLKFTETIAMLGETTDLDFDEAAQSLARFINITGEGTQSIDQVADVIVDLGNNSATTESQIVNMATRLASAFTIAGATQGEILAIAAAMSSVGIEAEAGGSAASRAITQMSDAVKDGGKELASYAKVAGVLPEEFARIAEASPVEALVLFTEGLGEMSEAGQSITPVLDELDLSGLRVRRSLESMGLASDVVREALHRQGVQTRIGGAQMEEYGKRIETTASRIEIFKGRLNSLAIGVGTPLLDGVVAVVDSLGDGLEFVVEAAGPLGRELAEMLGNVADAAGVFMDVIGGPALQAFAASLYGALQVGAGLLDLFNQLGAVGPPLAAVLATVSLFPGALATAASSAAAVATNVQLVGVRATAAAGGMKILNAAAAAGPWVVLAGALAVVGKALYDAKQQAEETGAAFEESLSAATEAGDFSAFESTLDRLIARQRELEEASVETGSAWDQFKKGFSQGFGDSAEGLEQITGTRAELEELNRVLGESGAEDYDAGIAKLAASLGLTKAEVAALASEQGLHNEVMAVGAGTNDAMVVASSRAAKAIGDQAEEMSGLAEATGLAIDRILAGEASMVELEEAVGVTASGLQFLADRIDGVELEDLFDEEKAAGAFDAINELNSAYEVFADQIGVSTDEMYKQVGALGELAASHSDLRSAIDGSKSALQLLDEQQRVVAESTAGFEEALDSIGETGGLEAAASAMRDLTFEYAGSGVSAEEAARKQVELYSQFREVAIGAGYTEEAARDAAVALGLIPEETIALIAAEADEYFDTAGEVRSDVEDLEGGYDLLLGAVDNASLIIKSVDGVARAFPNTYEAELAVADNASGKVEDATELSQDFEATRTVELEAEDRGSSIIQRFLDKINAIPGYKSITVDTITRSSSGGTVRFRADGGIQRFAGGGFSLEKPGTANIYSPSSTYRVFAEPETGGEAYIPLAPAKRGRSMQILRETARIMGASVSEQADGGIQRYAGGGISTRQFSNGPGQLPTIVVDVAIDAASVGNLEVDLGPANRAIADTGRRLAATTVEADRFVQSGGRVAGSLDGVAMSAEDTGRRLALALRPGEFLDTFSQISGWAKDNFREFLGEWDGTVAQAIAKLEAAELPLGHIFEAIAEQGGGIGPRIVEGFQAAGVDMRAIAADTGRDMLESMDPEPFLDTFSRISGWAKESFVDWLASWDSSQAEAVDKLRATGASIEEIFAQVFSADEAIRQVEDAGLEMRHIFREVFEEGVSDAEILDAAIGRISESMEDVESATRRADDAFRLLTGTSRGLLDSQLDYLDAVERVKEAIAGDDEGAGVFGMVGDEARRNYQDLLRAGDAMREYGLEIAGSGIGAQEAIDRFGQLRAEFRGLASDAGLSKGEVDLLVDTLFSVPAVTIAELAVEGQQAETDVARLERSLSSLGAMRPMPAPGVDRDAFDESVAAAGRAIDELDGKTATTVVQNTIKTTTTSEYKGGTYTIQKGDSWWAMAAKLWGDPTRYRELAAKNKADPAKTIYPGQTIAFAAGGLDVANRHTAGIHRTMRVFAEPETGGEAYIPLAADWRRARALEVWRQTGSALGVQQFASGGMRMPGPAAGGVTLNAPVSIEVSGTSGMDEQQLASKIEARVLYALDRAGRELMNMRR